MKTDVVRYKHNKKLWLHITVEKQLIGEEGLRVIATCGVNKKARKTTK